MNSLSPDIECIIDRMTHEMKFRSSLNEILEIDYIVKEVYVLLYENPVFHRLYVSERRSNRIGYKLVEYRLIFFVNRGRDYLYSELIMESYPPAMIWESRIVEVDNKFRRQ